MANKKKTTKKVIKKITFKEQFKAYNEVCVAGRRYYWQYKKPILYLVKHNGTITYLSDSVIKSHILGDIKEGHVVCLGFSPFVDNQNVLFGGIDFDVHGYTPKQRELELKKLDGNNEELKKQEEIYKQIQRDEIKKDIPAFCNALDEFGYLYFLNNSGSEGQHLKIYSNEPINAKIMQYFLKDLSVKLVGRDDKHEFFQTN